MHDFNTDFDARLVDFSSVAGEAFSIKETTLHSWREFKYGPHFVPGLVTVVDMWSPPQ
jgi:hypothetical protein